MADYPIYRLVKGDQLTFTEMDDNLRWLSQNMSGSQLTLTGSSIGVSGSMKIIGDIQVTGTASIGYLKTNAFSSGSNQLGDDVNDVQTLIGLVAVSGSMIVSGSAQIPNLTGSLFGTASYSVSASYVSGSAAFVTNLTSSNDASINGVRAGAGGGSNSVFNTVLGRDSFGSMTTGYSNVAVGHDVMNLATTAIGNTAVGKTVLSSLTTGQSNTAIGNSSMRSIQNGSNNTAIGRQALDQVTGNFNIGVGVLAGYTFTSGQYNIHIGSTINPGTGITNGSYNTVIGNQISGLNNPSNNIIISDGQGNIKYRWDSVQNNIYGNLAVTGSVTATQGFTGSLFGTSSWAVSASSAPNVYNTNGSLTSDRTMTLGSNFFTIGNFKFYKSGASDYVSYTSSETVFLNMSGTSGTQITFNYGFLSAAGGVVNLGSSQSQPIAFFTNNVKVAQANTNGNWIIQTGGTYADNGFKLDVSGSLRATNGLVVTGSIVATQNLTASAALINGTITAQTLVVQTVTSSILYSSGSNILGNNLSNTQTMTGSVNVTGSMTVNGPLTVSTTTGVFLPPRMTSTQRIALGTPTVGSMVYQTDATEGVYVYTSTGWRSLTMV